MKKIIGLLLCTLLLSCSIFQINIQNVFAETELDIVGSAAVLIDGATGQVLYEKNMHERKAPASTTKIMTGILAIESLDFTTVVVADQEAAAVEPTNLKMKIGERFTVEQLVNAMLIKSANDTAILLAKTMGGTVEEFADLMNAKAKEVGALDTTFKNANGLTHPEHLTTAYDLAQMARYAMKNTTFREIVTKGEYVIPPTNMTEEHRLIKSTNELLFNIKNIAYNGQPMTTEYGGATGIKTGYTKAAGKCFVGSAIRGGRELITVVLGSDEKNMSLDTIKMLDYGFENYKNYTVPTDEKLSKGIKIRSGEKQKVRIGLAETPLVTIPASVDVAGIRGEIEINENLTAPVTLAQEVGVYNIYDADGILRHQISIVATESVDASAWLDPIATIKGIGKSLIVPSIIFLAVILLLTMVYVVLAIKAKGKQKNRQRTESKPIFAKKRRFR